MNRLSGDVELSYELLSSGFIEFRYFESEIDAYLLIAVSLKMSCKKRR